MNLEGSYTFEAPRDVVWQALLDPDVLAKTMPGCEKLEQTGENEYEGLLNIKVGPVQGKFQGGVSLSDIEEPDSYHLSVNGKGAPGFMKGEGSVRLEAQDDVTVMHYSGTAQVGGRIASVGQRLLDSSAKALTRQSLDGLHEQIKARMQASKPDADQIRSDRTAAAQPKAQYQPSSEVTGPSQTEFAVGVAKNMLDDLLPAEQRPKLIVAVVGALLLFILINWWLNAVARKAAAEVLERRFD